jgi:hypothetical protein
MSDNANEPDKKYACWRTEGQADKEKAQLRAALSEKYFGGAFMMPSQRPTEKEQCLHLRNYRHLLTTSLRPATPQPDVSLVQAALDSAFQSLDAVTRNEIRERTAQQVAARRAERGPSEELRRFNEEHERAMAALAAGPTPKSASCTSTRASPPASAPRSVSIGYSGPPPSISKDAKAKKNKKRDLRTSYWQVKADFSGLDETTEDDIFHSAK